MLPISIKFHSLLDSDQKCNTFAANIESSQPDNQFARCTWIALCSWLWAGMAVTCCSTSSFFFCSTCAPTMPRATCWTRTPRGKNMNVCVCVELCWQYDKTWHTYRAAAAAHAKVISNAVKLWRGSRWALQLFSSDEMIEARAAKVSLTQNQLFLCSV